MLFLQYRRSDAVLYVSKPELCGMMLGKDSSKAHVGHFYPRITRKDRLAF